MKIVILALCVYFCPPMFLRLARQWAPMEFAGQDAADHEQRARILRARFWRGFAFSIGTICAVLVFSAITQDFVLRLDIGDRLRIMAVIMVLTAALGRGGWAIQTWKEQTTVERIDRGMYMVAQLGGAALLIFVLTL